MQAITANDLKTHGIGDISRALELEREVGLSVRGELRDVVMEADAYQRLRESELDIALQEARAALVRRHGAAGVPSPSTYVTDPPRPRPGTISPRLSSWAFTVS